MVVDRDNLITESNETNNKAYKSLSVGPAEVISFTVTDYGSAGVQFGTPDPGIEDQPADQAPTQGAVTLTVGAETNVNCNIQVKGADFARTGGGTITIDNAKWDTDNDVAGGHAMSTTYVTIDTSTAGVQKIVNVWHWLTIPSAQTAGDYTSTFCYQAIKQ